MLPARRRCHKSSARRLYCPRAAALPFSTPDRSPPMPETSRHSLAILGAGPVGLEAAALALELGFDMHVLERGEPGAHAIAWGHVDMFTPWRMNVGPASARLLTRNGWSAPP